MQKKIAMLLVAIMLICSMPTVFAEDVNPFPPQRDSIGVMKVVEEGGVVVGLRTNGTIITLGFVDLIHDREDQEAKKAEIAQINNAVDIDICDDFYIAVLDNTGHVNIIYLYVENSFFEYNDSLYDAESWTDIAHIYATSGFIVGLKTDGTVVAAGDNSKGQCNVSGWKDVSDIHVGDGFTIGIKCDGTLLVAGETGYYKELKKLTNVKKICTDQVHGLYTDGTIFPEVNVLIDPDSYKRELKSITINQLLKDKGYDINIVDMDGAFYYHSDLLCILDDKGDFYVIELDKSHLTTDEGEFAYITSTEVEKLEGNIYSFDKSLGSYGSGYYAVDKNGQVLSGEMAFDSSDWVLTTNITYNGQKIESDTAPFVENGRTLAPLRAILETLGMTVSWDDATQTATAIKGEISISVTIGYNIAIVNGEEKILDVPAKMSNDRTFVPVRFFAESLNMNVDWDDDTKTVLITSN